MKQRLNSFACLKYRGQHGYAQEVGKLFKIDVITTLLRFIKHIQSTNHGHVHINKLRREIKIAFQITTVDDIDDHVGILLNELFTHIKFLWRIGRQAVCTGQVNKVQSITFKRGVSFFGIHRDTRIIAYMLMRTRHKIE